MELMREVVPRLQNRTVLILSDNVGMFYLQDQLAALDMYQFCRNTFHDMITGCKNDRLSFLKVPNFHAMGKGHVVSGSKLTGETGSKFQIWHDLARALQPYN